MRVHPGLKVRKSPGLRKRTNIRMAADRAANNFSPQIRDCFVTSDIRRLCVKFLLVGGMGRFHTRIDKA